MGAVEADGVDDAVVVDGTLGRRGAVGVDDVMDVDDVVGGDGTLGRRGAFGVLFTTEDGVESAT